MTKKLTDSILEFMGAEHTNELVSIANLREQLGYLQELDDIFNEIRRTFSAEGTSDLDCIVAILSLQAHNEFFISMSQHLKCHLSQAYISLRLGIESSFLAYYFTQYPENCRVYFDKEGDLHRKVFWRIKEHLKQDLKTYPLAKKLIGQHENISNFSAHASFNSLVYKYKHILDEKNKIEELSIAYFDELDVTDFMFHYYVLLISHYDVFKLLYDCFFGKKFRIHYPERDERIKKLEKNLQKMGHYYRKKKDMKYEDSL